MSKQFVKGNVYVFTKKKLLKNMRKIYHNNRSSTRNTWANEVNGNIVTVSNAGNAWVKNYGDDACVKTYSVDPEWCKCIKNNNPKIESEEI